MKKERNLFVYLLLISIVFCGCLNGQDNNRKSGLLVKNWIVIPVLNNTAKITIPSNFKPLPESDKLKKYPKNPPQEVYANEDGTISVGLSNLNQDLPESELGNYTSIITQGIKQNIPSARWYFSSVKNIKGRNVGILKFDSPAIDGWIYNVMCLTIINGKLIMYTFNCMDSQKNGWESKGNEIVESLKAE